MYASVNAIPHQVGEGVVVTRYNEFIQVDQGHVLVSVCEVQIQGSVSLLEILHITIYVRNKYAFRYSSVNVFLLPHKYLYL